MLSNLKQSHASCEEKPLEFFFVVVFAISKDALEYSHPYAVGKSERVESEVWFEGSWGALAGLCQIAEYLN